MPVSRLKVFWSLVLAVALGYSVYAYLNRLQDRVAVVVASRDIPARARITADMVEIARVGRADAERLAARAFRRVEEVVDAVAVQDIPRGEALRDDPRWVAPRRAGLLAPDGAVRLSHFLPPEGRAETVTLDAQGAVGRLLKRGDRVDVIFTSQDNSSGGVYSALIMQGVPVLEVEAPTKELLPAQTGGQINVTLLVTPAQAVDLALAKRRGSIDLVLSPETAEPVTLPPSSPLKFTADPTRDKQATAVAAPSATEPAVSRVRSAAEGVTGR